MDEATIEGPDPTYPAFVIRPSREVDEVDLRVCLSWGQALSQGFVLGYRERNSFSGRQGLTPAATERGEWRTA